MIDRTGDLLEAARRAKGLTEAELGTMVGVSQAAINRYEKGEREPDEPMIGRLSEALGITSELIKHGANFRGAIALDSHMRRQTSTKASLWRGLEARLNMLRVHSSLLFEEVSVLAEARVPTFDPEFTMPAEAARLVRAQWKMPLGPVANVIRWIEAAGCLIFEQDFGTRRIDGLSQWVGDHPLMLVNPGSMPDRKRMTVAHELGHLVLHSNDVTEDMERQANDFASEFLMPELAIRPELTHLDLGSLIELKREWGVSMQAIFERAYAFGLATSDERIIFYKRLNARGWKTREPASDALPNESPRFARHIGSSLQRKGLSSPEIAKLAGYRDERDNPFTPEQPHLTVV